MTKLAALLLVAAVATVSGEGFQKQAPAVSEIMAGTESITPITNKSVAARHLLLLGDTGNICYTGSSCVSSSYQCASGYSCYLVTDGSCNPSNCNTCSAGSTYYGCYTSQPGTTTVTYEQDSISGLRCYSSSSNCNSVASNSCTSSGTSCTYGSSSYCSTTSSSYNYYCPNSVSGSTPSASSPSNTPASTPGGSTCTVSAGCKCTDCTSARTCAYNQCSGLTSFTCSTTAGITLWQGICPVSASAKLGTMSALAALAAVTAPVIFYA